MKTIDVRLMAYSFSGKRSSGREGRRERPATDSKQRTRTKRSSLSLQQSDLSSRYILKHSKIDISRNVKSVLDTLAAVAAIRRASQFHAGFNCGRKAGSASRRCRSWCHATEPRARLSRRGIPIHHDIYPLQNFRRRQMANRE